MRLKTLQTDNGREFTNEAVAEWCKKYQVEHYKTVPYYHQGKDRVERVNRTLRLAIVKTKGCVRIKLGAIVDKYHKSYHRGIGCTPNDACDPKKTMLH